MDKEIDVWKQRNEILHKKVNRQMAEIKDLNKKSETIFDLARKFPDKTYSELEQYRDADRQEEAHSIPLTEEQQSLVKEVEKAINKNKGVCISAELKKDRTPLENMKRRAQEAEGELSILKGLETNRVKEAQAALADSLEVNESHQRLNGKLQARVAELEDDNKKLSSQIEDQLDRARKAGL